MNRDRRSKRHNSSWKNNRNSERTSAPSKPVFRPPRSVTPEQIRTEEESIRTFKSENQPECPKCGRPILDMSLAIADRTTGQPIHFDCAIEELSKEIHVGQGEKITYIGQGRFGVVYHENPHDPKHFTIRKIIDWEDKETKASWRNELAELYSRIK